MCRVPSDLERRIRRELAYQHEREHELRARLQRVQQTIHDLQRELAMARDAAGGAWDDGA